MNIENEFNKIVSGLKEFRNHDFLENEIKKSFLEMIYKLEGKRVIIRGAGIHTEHFLDNIKREGYLSKINILAIVDDILCGEEIEGIKIINKNMQEKIKYDSVVISSFSYRKEMKKDYDGNKINLVDLYDELEKKNRKYIQLQVSDIPKASLILERQFHVTDYAVQDEHNLRLYDTALDMAAINKALVVQDVAVISSQICNDTLEDYFKQITGGEGIA